MVHYILQRQQGHRTPIRLANLPTYGQYFNRQFYPQHLARVDSEPLASVHYHRKNRRLEL